MALVELKGTAADCELLERALDEQGWPVFERRGQMSEVVDRLIWYVVETRFPGSSRNAARGARERIELLADELQVDLQVQAVELLVRDPADLPHWFAYEPPATHPRTVSLPQSLRWRERLDSWLAEHAGTRDTGRLVLARTPGEARHLATRSLPGVPRYGGRVAARRPSGGSTRPVAPRVGRREGSSRLVRLVVLFVVGAWAGASLADGHAGGVGWWSVLAVLCGVAGGAATVWRAMAPGATRTGSFVFGCLFTLIAVTMGVSSARAAPNVGYGSSVLLVGLVGAVLVNGVRLLVRQWSWQRTAPWLIPALVPLCFGFLPGLGLGIHTMYLDAFGLNLEDVEIPRAYQLIAMLKLTACVSLWLFAPSLLGYMKHFHLYVKDRWFGNAVLLTVSVALLTQGVLGLGLVPAGQAGADAVADAAKGRTPAAYYGIEPEWVCVLPVGRLDGVPVDGGALSVTTAYLKLGDAVGTVVLWDPRSGSALKAPLDRLRIAPREKRPASCASR
ncbi:hypothetical protein [Streptomyces sp. NPDC093111]|uniref:hypothetical protein n=1 Tax=Streptomyces sp. NPDC093111 TaxID=3154978 RepID=UPI0034169004